MRIQYSALFQVLGSKILAIVSTPAKKELVQNVLEKEENLYFAQQSFAEKLLEFEEAREREESTIQQEEAIKQATIGVQSAREQLQVAKNDLYYGMHSIDLDEKTTLFLTQWIERRQNDRATKAVAEALINFSEVLIQN